MDREETKDPYPKRVRNKKKQPKKTQGTNPETQRLNDQIKALQSAHDKLRKQIGHNPSYRDVQAEEKYSDPLRALINDYPRAKNQQRKLLEALGQKYITELADYGDIPKALLSAQAGTPQYVEKLKAERRALVDDLPGIDQFGQSYTTKSSRKFWQPPNFPGKKPWMRVAEKGMASAQSYLMGQITGGQLVSPSSSVQPASSYDMNAIDMEYVSTVVVPEDYSARSQQDEMVDTSMARGKQTYKVVTNANGDVGAFVFPNQPLLFIPVAQMAGAFIAGLNGADFNPGTGTQSTSPAFVTGPLGGSLASAVLQYKCTGFSINFLPTESSLNNQGEYFMAYFPKAPTLSAEDSNVIAIPLSQMQNTSWYQTSSMKTECGKRMIKAPTPGDQFIYNSNSQDAVAPPFSNFFYQLWTGCQPSYQIGVIEISYTYEFDPALESLPICPTGQSLPGAMTPQLLTNLFKEHKQLQSLNRADARSLIQKVRSWLPQTHDEAIAAFRKAMAFYNSVTGS